MCRSRSTLAINWHKPSLAEEEWEFSKHPAKQPFYEKHGITWDDISQAFDRGSLEPWPRSPEICGVTVALAYYGYEDYRRYLARAKRGYRLNYNRMEEALQRDGTLDLPAAIVLRAGDEGLLFSGYRRLCLAWNYGMVPFVWLVGLANEGGKDGKH